MFPPAHNFFFSIFFFLNSEYLSLSYSANWNQLPFVLSIVFNLVCLHIYLQTPFFSPALISLFRPLDTEVAMTLMKTLKGETKWRRLWRRESLQWCVYIHTHYTTQCLCPSHLAGLDLDQRKVFLSLQAWWRLEHGDMLPASSVLFEKESWIQQGNRREAGV